MQEWRGHRYAQNCWKMEVGRLLGSPGEKTGGEERILLTLKYNQLVLVTDRRRRRPERDVKERLDSRVALVLHPVTTQMEGQHFGGT